MAVNRVRVWDLPLRLFHWALAVCVTGSLVTATLGGFWMDYHLLFGYVALGLISFRLVWGCIGPATARFTNFVRGPRAILAYLRSGPETAPYGHNPLGGWSVLAMLCVLGVQAVTGLFADDGIFTQGPLAARASPGTVDFLTGWHLRLEPVIYTLLGLHLAAVAWHSLVRRHPLVRAMITGERPDTPGRDVPPTQDDARVRLRAAIVAAICAASVAGVVALGGSSL
ncbi:cytochrome B [Verticiella sediminum]|uniref:Cytochrome B n=1 Tax=Verticiella sediminum TaxID=1247510 RepID=A0A556A971_9BURK|nr:cytochrome b/b6 domain-containing protein [Verticiella sediminum]TSH89434.1 cytochrome B [Verticiella sediminum]